LLFSRAGIAETKQVYELFITYIRAGKNTIGKSTYFSMFFGFFYVFEWMDKGLKKWDFF